MAFPGPAAISTGEWLIIGLASGALAIEAMAAIIAWVALRRPPKPTPTGIRSRGWRAERHDGHLHIFGTVEFLPVGPSFRIVNAECTFTPYQGKKGTLAPVNTHSAAPLEGAQVLEFSFREQVPPDEQFRYPQKVPFGDIDVWIELADGASLRDVQRGLILEQDVIHLVAHYDPDRTPPQMAREGFRRLQKWAVKTWHNTPVIRAWKNLRHH